MSCEGCRCMTGDMNPLVKICGRLENGYVYECDKACCKVDCSGSVVTPMQMLSARLNKPIQNAPLTIGNNLMTATVSDDDPTKLPGSPFKTIKAVFQDSNTPKQFISLMGILLVLLILSTVLLFF